MSDALPLADYRVPVLITLGYLFVYYGLMLNVLRAKVRARRGAERRGEAFDRYRCGDRRLLTADRTMLNMLEHMPAFLSLYWLSALFNNDVFTHLAGGLYVATRAAYPFLMGPVVPARLPLRLLASTYSGYAILIWLAVRLLARCFV